MSAAMPKTTRLGLSIMGAALGLGVLGDVLRASPLGVNVVVWIGALLLAVGLLARSIAQALRRQQNLCQNQALLLDVPS